MEELKENKPATKFTLKPKPDNYQSSHEYYQNSFYQQKSQEALLNLSKVSTLMQISLCKHSSLESIQFQQFSKINDLE